MKTLFHKIVTPVFVCCLMLVLAGNGVCKVSATEHIIKADSLKQELLKSQCDTSRLQVLYALASHYKYYEPDIALSYANDAIQLSKQTKNDYQTAMILRVTGIIYEMKADYPKALFCYFQSIRFMRTLNKENQISYLLNDIGCCYIIIKKYDLAKRYLIESLNIRLKQNLVKGIEDNYTNLGIVFTQLGQTQEGIAYYRKAIEANNNHAAAYNNIGDIYMKLNQLQKAEYYYKKCLELNAPNDIYGLLSCYNSLGHLYLLKRDFKQSEKYLFMAEKIAEQSGVLSNVQTIYTSIVELYEEQSDFKNAHIYNKYLHQLKDSIFQDANTRQINEMQAKYELERKDKEIQLAKVEIDKANTNRILFIAALMFVIIISSILYRNVVLKQKVNKVLYEKNAELEEKNMELNEKNNRIAFQKQQIEDTNKKLSSFNKDLMLENISARYEMLKSKTNPHFLFNNLNTLSSLIIRDSKRALEYVAKFAKLYRNILELNDKQLITLREELILVNNYLYLQQIRFGENLQITIHISAACQHYKVPPFCLQLLVENAIKHNKITDEEPLHITIEAKDRYLCVENNLQKRANQEKTTGIGQRNIKERYLVLSTEAPVFIQTESKYVAKVPLIREIETEVVQV